MSRKALALVALCLIVAPARAQDAIEQFYRGKNLTIVIGSNVGGGYDAYGRLVGRYIGKYLPGHPTVVYNNMVGAGGATAVNDLVSIAPRDTVEEAWVRLGEHSIKALPVVRDDGTLAGIVSLHDFFVAHGTSDPRQLPAMSTARHVQDIMTRRVRVARPEQPMVDLVALFSDGGLHHLPVVDDQLRVVGMITQSDMVAALFRTHSTDDATPPPATLLPA